MPGTAGMYSVVTLRGLCRKLQKHITAATLPKSSCKTATGKVLYVMSCRVHRESRSISDKASVHADICFWRNVVAFREVPKHSKRNSIRLYGPNVNDGNFDEAGHGCWVLSTTP